MKPSVCSRDEHEAIIADDARWAELTPGGLWQVFDDEPALELKHCVCGSTISRPVSE